MARTKYKIGTFVKTAETEDSAPHYGAVEEIRLTAAGTEYKLTGMDEPVTEDDIATAYREITPRKTTPKASTKGRTSKRNREAQANAAA